LISAVTAIIFSFIMMPVLRYCGKCMVFTCILLVIVSIFAGGYFMYAYGIKAQSDGSLSASRADACLYTAYVLWGIDGIFVLVMFFMRKRILIAIGVVKEAARAMTDMPLLIVFPIVPVLVGCCYICWWLVMMTYIWSVSKLTPHTTAMPAEIKYYVPPFFYLAQFVQKPLQAVDYANGVVLNDLSTEFPIQYYSTQEKTWQYVGAYLFFHLLWVTQFLYYFTYLTFAGAVADWYFTPRDKNGDKPRGLGADKLSRFPIVTAACRTIRYHLGTVAVCSFIIAVIQFMRAVVMYIEAKTATDPPNKLQKCVFCMIKCYLRCLECCMDKINQNALIWCAIWGDNFGSSACSSFMLVWANLARCAMIGMVSGILLKLSKFTIAFGNTAIFCAIFAYHWPVSHRLYSIVLPTLLVLMLSWYLASMFLCVFKSVIDAVFLCFLVDADVNPAGQMVASVELQKLVGKYQKENTAEADKQKKIRESRPGYEAVNGSETKVMVKPKENGGTE